MTGDLDDESRRSPVRELVFLVVLNALAVVGLGVLIAQTAESQAELLGRQARLLELQGEITYLDEVLTMSTYMATASGDLAWERRYLYFEPILSERIAEAAAMATVDASIGIAGTDAANDALVALEKRAFELVRRHRLADAMALIDSHGYRIHKQRYADGQSKFMDALRVELKGLVGQSRARSHLAWGIAMIVGVLLAVGWVLVVRRVEMWRGQKLMAEQKLRSVLRRLAEINAHLENQVAKRTDALQQSVAEKVALAEELFMAEASERERLALVLHDDLQQQLVGAQLRLSVVSPSPGNEADLHAVRRAIDHSLQLSRDLAMDLSLESVLDGPIAAGVRQVVHRFEHHYGLEVRADIQSTSPLPAAVGRLVLRSCNELLFNVVKHAPGARAWLVYVQERDTVVLEVRDDGPGMDDVMAEARRMPTGLGLNGIRRRLEWLGGELSVGRSPKGGMFVRLQVPVDPVATVVPGSGGEPGDPTPGEGASGDRA